MAATVDTTAILLEELAKLGEPLPLGIAAHGFSRIADDVARVLDERGQQSYSAAQWRSALKEVFRKLTDDKGDLRKRSPNLAHRKDAVKIDGRALDARAQEILAANNVYDPTAEDYMNALEAAQAETVSETRTSVYRGDPGGVALHLTAMKILEDRGKAWDHDADDYKDALDEAAVILSIDLTGRN
jgi:hypothetical protein